MSLFELVPIWKFEPIPHKTKINRPNTNMSKLYIQRSCTKIYSFKSKYPNNTELNSRLQQTYAPKVVLGIMFVC